jgi:hypothetical protein
MEKIDGQIKFNEMMQRMRDIAKRAEASFARGTFDRGIVGEAAAATTALQAAMARIFNPSGQISNFDMEIAQNAVRNPTDVFKTWDGWKGAMRALEAYGQGSTRALDKAYFVQPGQG